VQQKIIIALVLTLFIVIFIPLYWVIKSGQHEVAGPAAIAAGKQLYQTYCASCHGANGAGGIKIGEATSADIRFTALNDMYSGDWSLAKRAILDGIDEEGEDLDAAMPRWRGQISDSDVSAIVQYLQTLK
jgi:cytochrome c oxidase subunit 2